MTYNIKTTKILFTNPESGSVSFCTPTGDLDIETVAKRDLPIGSPYWIVDFETEENLEQKLYSNLRFGNALELDEEILGTPNGISIGPTFSENQRNV